MAKKQSFNIPDPKAQVEQLSAALSRYRVGEPNIDFHHIRQLKPVFAFDYISLRGEDLCFNAQGLTGKDYVGFIEGLKKVSEKTYEELQTNRAFRFHRISFDDKKVAIKPRQLREILGQKESVLPDEQLPTLYQFDIQYVREARICGFIFRSVFYVVWYDRNHQIYPRS